jgi:hypothetical protein
MASSEEFVQYTVSLINASLGVTYKKKCLVNMQFIVILK